MQSLPAKQCSPSRTGLERFFLFLMPLLPVFALLLWLATSEWFFNRYGFFGAWVLVPAVLVTIALALTALYYCCIVVAGSILFRVFVSLALAIVGVVLAVGLCLLAHGLLPHSHHPGI
jgi:hypothetical protein